jgi:4a-hydroxytetrahydrobiopterin dehydratase
MAALAQATCEACSPQSPRVTEDEAAEYQREIPEWEIVEREGEQRLERSFTFPDFASALAFTNAVGVLAEAENHHPSLLTEWGKVTVAWWTHTIGGLHKNDFIMAARTDDAYAKASAGR